MLIMVITLPHRMTLLAFGSTLLNILCGVSGIIAALDNNNTVAFQFIVLGAIFDFLDGKFAKRAPTRSDLGVYMDSLGDVITFSILPGYMILNVNVFLGEVQQLGWIANLSLASIFAICAWVRLIRFALHPTGVYFEGLPSPAAALLLGSLIIVSSDESMHWLFPKSGIIFSILALLVSLLMISHILYPSPKRLYVWDNVLITVAALSGLSYVLIPSTIAAFSMVVCGLLYLIFGPYYAIITENRKSWGQESSHDNNSSS